LVMMGSFGRAKDNDDADNRFQDSGLYSLSSSP
jgi:hypothetical protein